MTRRSKTNSNVFFGVLLIVVGGAFLLDNLGYLEAWRIFRFWPVLLIAYGLYRVSNSYTPRGRIIGLFFAGFGVLLLLDRLYYFEFNFWEVFWPALIILAGLSLLLNYTRSTPVVTGGEGMPTGTEPPLTGSTEIPPAGAWQAGASSDFDSVVNLSAFLSGVNRTVMSQDFRGGSLSAFMGGVDLDLRQASIRSSQAVINVSAIMGGIKIKVPQDWSVSVHGTPIMGGLDDKTFHKPGETTKQLVVTGEAIMGGVEVSN